MGYSVSTRKFGDGYTYFVQHGSHAAPFNGEIDFPYMLLQSKTPTNPNLGGYSEGAVLEIETESYDDEISQEMFPVQTKPIGGAATFKVIMSMGDAAKLAIAAGLTSATSESDILGSGLDADTIVAGAVSPATLSLLHVVPNSQDPGKYDYVYMPRVQVDGRVLMQFKKKEVRDAEVIFKVLPSTQDGTSSSENMKLPNGTFGVAKVFYQKTEI